MAKRKMAMTRSGPDFCVGGAYVGLGVGEAEMREMFGVHIVSCGC